LQLLSLLSILKLVVNLVLGVLDLHQLEPDEGQEVKSAPDSLTLNQRGVRFARQLLQKQIVGLLASNQCPPVGDSRRGEGLTKTSK